MSTFPQHSKNIKDLQMMGFDVDEAIEDGKVTMESWGYDEQTYLLDEIIQVLKAKKFKVGNSC